MLLVNRSFVRLGNRYGHSRASELESGLFLRSEVLTVAIYSLPFAPTKCFLLPTLKL